MAFTGIIDVQITRETAGVTQQGFSNVIFVGIHKVFTGRQRLYSSTQALIDDGFTSDSPQVKAATAIFSQNPRPQTMRVGRRQADSIILLVDTIADNTDYTVTINGTDFTIDSGVGATNLTIAAALVAEIDGGAEPVDATDNVDGTFYITGTPSTLAFTVTFSSNLVIAGYLSPESYTDALNAINADGDDWYGLAIESIVQSDVEEVASWTEPQIKLFVSASDDTDILDPGVTTDVASVVQGLSYDRTSILYHSLASTQDADVAWMGRQLAQPIGSSNWAFKTLSGVSPDDLSTSQKNGAFGKNANVYTTVGGVNITQEGTVAVGELLSVIVGVDFIKVRMDEALANLLFNSENVPLTDPGITLVENIINQQLQIAIGQGILAADPQPDIFVPKAADIPLADRLLHKLTGVTFQATLANSILFIEVRGTVSV
jgi:hypothetical protein